MHFLEWKFRLKFHRNLPPGVPINIPSLVQLMTWRRTGDKHYLNNDVRLLTHICVTRPQWVTNDLTIAINAEDERDLVTFEFKMGFWGIFNIAAHPSSARFHTNFAITLTLQQSQRFHFYFYSKFMLGVFYRALNSYPSSAAYMRHWTGSTLVKVKACRLAGAKPFPEPMLTHCQLHP